MAAKDVTEKLPPNETILPATQVRLTAEDYIPEYARFDEYDRLIIGFEFDGIFNEFDADALAAKYHIPLRRSRRLNAQAAIDALRDEARSALQRGACEMAQVEWSDTFTNALRAGAPQKYQTKSRWDNAVRNADTATIVEIGQAARAFLAQIETERERTEAHIAVLESLESQHAA